MSGNQIPHPLRYATPGAHLPGDGEWEGKPRQHSCPRCTMNGGVGHPLRELLKFARREQDVPDEQPVQPFRRTCTYWSARNRAYCGSTHKVEVHGAIGSRCVNHHPELMDAAFKALFTQAA